MERQQLARKLKSARKANNFSQVFMAESLGVARQTYLDLETGKTEPRVTTLSNISKLTNFPMSWFINETEEDIVLSSHMLSMNQQLLIHKYRQLPVDLQDSLIILEIDKLCLIINSFNRVVDEA